MSFVREEYGTIIRNSNGDFYIINFKDGISIKSNNLNNKKIIDGDYNFVDLWASIDNKDNIYGVLNDKEGALIYFYSHNNKIYKVSFAKYNANKVLIKFPYIKNIGNDSHIIYYLMNYEEDSYRLIHYYKHEGKIIENKIDTLETWILNNFCVEFQDGMPVIFYFKSIDGIEEIFTSYYDGVENKWSKPIQITNTGNQKIYLSLIKDEYNNYHLTYSENNYGRYNCMYLRVKLYKYKVTNKVIKTIKESMDCTFPQVIKWDDKIYIQWIEYEKLFGSYSYDYGDNWSKALPYKKSIYNDFSRYNYESNYLDDKKYNLTTVFANNDSLNEFYLDHFRRHCT